MPKRRSGRSKERPSSGESRGSGHRQKSRDRKQKVARQPSTSRRKGSEILLSLSDACNRHSAYHKKNAVVVTEKRGNFGGVKIPVACSKALTTLQRLMPAVENSFRPPEPGDRGSDADDVAHVCDFYMSIVHGIHCPHSPLLLQSGQDIDAVLARVYCMFQHVISPSVVASANRPLSVFNRRENSLRPVIQVVGNTIANLLGFLADYRLYESVTTDLIDMLTDCSVVLEGSILPSQVTILGETSQSISPSTDYCLTLENPVQVQLLQAVTMNILLDFLSCLRSKRLKQEYDETYRKACGSFDLLFQPSLVVEENLGFLLSSIRYVLLSTPPENSASPIWKRRHLAALTLLTALLRDWHKSIVSPVTMSNVLVLVGQAVRVQIQNRCGMPLQAAHRRLAIILRHTIIDPPRFKSVASAEGAFFVVGAQVLEMLLTCVKSIVEVEPHRRTVLDVMVLRTINVLVNRESHQAPGQSYLSIARNVCISEGLFQYLFALITSPDLCSLTSAILGNLLLSVGSFENVASICRWTVTNYEEVSKEYTGTARPATDVDRYPDIPEELKTAVRTPPSRASKRKRRSASPHRGKESPFGPSEISPLHTGKHRGIAARKSSIGADLTVATLWQEDLQTFLDSALRAARRLSETLLARQGGSVDGTADLSGYDSMVSISLICSAWRLVCGMIRKQNIQETAKGQSIADCLSFIALLSKCLRICCDNLSKRDPRVMTKLDWAVLSEIISCGIFGHLTVTNRLDYALSLSMKFVIDDFDAFACLGLSFLGVHDLPIHPGGSWVDSSTYRCSHNFTLQQIVKGTCNVKRLRRRCRFGVPLCLCSLLADFQGVGGFGADQMNYNTQAQDTLGVLIESLSLRTRCSLLVALRPPTKPVHAHPETKLPASTPNLAINSLMSMLHEKKEGGIGNGFGPATVSALFFAPAFIMGSIHRANNDELLTPEVVSMATSWLKQFVLPFLHGIKSDDYVTQRTVLLTMDRIRTSLLDSGAIMEDGFTIDRAVAYIFGGKAGGNQGRNGVVQANKPEDEIRPVMCDLGLEVALRFRRPTMDGQVRRLLWKVLAEIVIDSPPSELRQAIANRKRERTGSRHSRKETRSADESSLLWLLSIPFSDPDRTVRQYASRRIAELVLDDRAHYVMTLFASEEAFQGLGDNAWMEPDPSKGEITGSERKSLMDNIMTDFFREIDRLLKESCGFTDNQLSFTQTRATPEQPAKKEATEPQNDLQMQASAARIIVSLCVASGYRSKFEREIFQRTFLRVVRMWAKTQPIKQEETSFPDILSTSAGKAIAFGALSRVTALQRKIILALPDKFATGCFYDVFALANSRPRFIKFSLLGTLFDFFSRQNPLCLSRWQLTKRTLAFVNEKITAVMAEFIVEKDSEMLRLSAGFRNFAEEKYMKARIRQKKPRTVIAGSSNSVPDLNYDSLTATSADLGKMAKNLCLEPKLIDRILPLLFINRDPSSLIFFREDVIDKTKIRDLIELREQLILKGLIWELGRDEQTLDSATVAVRAAANARFQGTEVVISETTTDAQTKAATSGTKWVSKHFMYLLANIVQNRRVLLSMTGRVRALRCLLVMLELLSPVEAGQYLPQILSTVNAALAKEWDGQAFNGGVSAEELRLRLYAAKSLSKFIRLLLDHHVDIVAQNLTTIVVSLISILDEDASNTGKTEDRAGDASTEVAVSLLETLTSGAVGKKLAPHFSEIPFLPTYDVLDNVHSSLRANGIDFDNLVVLSSTARSGRLTMQGGSDVSGTALSGTSSASSRKWEKLRALQKRLGRICQLLDNANYSIRRVAVKHLTDILRANRDLFHALVESEASASVGLYLTVCFKDRILNGIPGGKDQNISLRGAVTQVMEKLLIRSVQEINPELRILLAECLGEFGAVDERRLGELKIGSAMEHEAFDAVSSSYKWRLDQPPWLSRPTKYQLLLLTRHLVAALKAAQTSSDQHKVAFAIQQLLRQLDASVEHFSGADKGLTSGPAQAPMSKWLKDQLCDAGVYEVIEPFWSSEFHEKSEAFLARNPPFFKSSKSHYLWCSHFSRWMVQSSKDTAGSKWKDFFYNCRTAIRTQAALHVIEFIFPLLVLDRICFGTQQDKEVIREEVFSVFDFEGGTAALMEMSERQRAVNLLFTTIDTLQYWAERETENRHRSTRSPSSSSNRKKASDRGGDWSLQATWPAEKSIKNIGELLSAIPLEVQAKAAAAVGMHARALRLLEMAARKETIDVFEDQDPAKKSGDKPTRPRFGFQLLGNPILSRSLDLMKILLARLDDCETMAAISKFALREHKPVDIRDCIQQKQASGDFEGAAKDYERTLQIRGGEPEAAKLRRGLLHCLLRLGQLEGVLNQVGGMKHSGDGDEGFSSYATEAAWRLGRWETLAELVERNVNSVASGSSYDVYQNCTGRALLALQRKDKVNVNVAIETARVASMESLSSFARESYARSFAEIVRLQCIRELENTVDVLCYTTNDCLPAGTELAALTTDEEWAWDGRLKISSSSGASPIVTTRVALARLSGDKLLEASLFLDAGKRARKNSMFTVSENYFVQAQATFALVPLDTTTNKSKLGELIYSTSMQLAKLKYATGERTLALRMLGHESVQTVVDEMFSVANKDDEIKEKASEFERKRIQGILGPTGSLGEPREKLCSRFASRLLKLTQWTGEGGLSGYEIIDRYCVIHKLSPDWEKGHFQFGKYMDSAMQSRVSVLASQMYHRDGISAVDEDTVRGSVIFHDKTCQSYILHAMLHYGTALKLDSKHVYQALPRLLSLWFDFASIQPEKVMVMDAGTPQRQSAQATLKKHQDEANAGMANNIKIIPPAAFYTAMPQLISRVTHDVRETSIVVQAILKRVLCKFPHQAMWLLAWLKGSRDTRRSEIGEEIFKEAERSLSKNKSLKNLVAAAGTLFRYLQELALLNPPERSSFSVKTWQGQIPLAEFIPPVQAALSISPTPITGRGTKEYFPRDIPRMRSFCSKVNVMSSKAKPKRLKAFAVPASFKPHHSRTSRSDPVTKSSTSNPQPGDIGEFHFLVKREAKGDLRKDARVQDLNNVINRLMSSWCDSNTGHQKRRNLKLRTFAVTCLTEDIGILEWVPETDSLRNLVTKSYHPQTSPVCKKRRGIRLANFADPALRGCFERAQNVYLKEGNLTRASNMFFNTCLKPNPPLLYWWFVQKFEDPHAWYEARNLFTSSAAAWSAVGHVIGLGDRHSENILVDTTNGQCVHVDFDCIFDKGLNLPRPEIVPFRLTPNMIDAFGPTGADGIYSSGLQTAMRTLRDNRDTLLSVLEPFLKDPVIDWKRHRSQQKKPSGSGDDRLAKDAKRSIRVIDERLQGIYNLQNPNYKKHKRTDNASNDLEDDVSHLIPLSVEVQVQKMITEATSHENYVQLYVGWMPWV